MLNINNNDNHQPFEAMKCDDLPLPALSAQSTKSPSINFDILQLTAPKIPDATTSNLTNIANNECPTPQKSVSMEMNVENENDSPSYDVAGDPNSAFEIGKVLKCNNYRISYSRAKQLYVSFMNGKIYPNIYIGKKDPRTFPDPHLIDQQQNKFNVEKEQKERKRNKDLHRKVIQPKINSFFEKWKFENNDNNKQKQRQQLSSNDDSGVRKVFELTPRRQRKKPKNQQPQKNDNDGVRKVFKLTPRRKRRKPKNQMVLTCFFNQKDDLVQRRKLCIYIVLLLLLSMYLYSLIAIFICICICVGLYLSIHRKENILPTTPKQESAYPGYTGEYDIDSQDEFVQPVHAANNKKKKKNTKNKNDDKHGSNTMSNSKTEQ